MVNLDFFMFIFSTVPAGRYVGGATVHSRNRWLGTSDLTLEMNRMNQH